jgi:hypothetical protein
MHRRGKAEDPEQHVFVEATTAAADSAALYAAVEIGLKVRHALG